MDPSIPYFRGLSNSYPPNGQERELPVRLIVTAIHAMMGAQWVRLRAQHLRSLSEEREWITFNALCATRL